MRKIKFRAKNTKGEWVEGSLITNKYENSEGKQFDVSFIAEGLPCMEQQNDMWTIKMQRVEPSTIGQHTSLMDKFGKPIYEGDIIRAGEEKTLLEVRFVRGVFAFLWNGDLDDEFPTGSPTHEWAEVVGNIHDNPNMIRKH